MPRYKTKEHGHQRRRESARDKHDLHMRPAQCGIAKGRNRALATTIGEIQGDAIRLSTATTGRRIDAKRLIVDLKKLARSAALP